MGDLLLELLPLVTDARWLGGLLALEDLHALSQTCAALRQALVQAPAAFWQVRLSDVAVFSFSQSQPSSSRVCRRLWHVSCTPATSSRHHQAARRSLQSQRRASRTALLRKGALPASCCSQFGAPPFATPRQPDLSHWTILKSHDAAATPALKLHPLSFASPPHRLTVCAALAVLLASSLQEPGSAALVRRSRRLGQPGFCQCHTTLRLRRALLMGSGSSRLHLCPSIPSAVVPAVWPVRCQGRLSTCTAGVSPSC